MTVFMVTHDLSEAFKLGTRVIAFDRRSTRPEEMEAYGATITFDLPVYHPVPKPEELVQDFAEELDSKAAIYKAAI
jgi:NitT/TauT family transport system ATP-binding protein